MTLLAEKPPKRFASKIDDAGHILLWGVSWDYFLRTLDELDGQRLKVTYDDGEMEIMTPPIGNLHDYAKTCIARLLETYAVAIDRPMSGFGEVTHTKKKARKGLQPDECYWIQTKPPRIRRTWLKLEVDPRPDLVVEVEVTAAVIDRLRIYAAFEVPEVWRFIDRRVAVFQLDAGTQTYREATSSLAFPDLSMAKFNQFLKRALRGDQHGAATAILRWAQTSKK